MANAVNTPAMTAKHQPVVITIQPDFSPLVCRNTTFATTPLPSRIMIIVPRNSPRNAECMPSPRYFSCSKFSVRSGGPIQRTAHRLLPGVEQCRAAIFRHLRIPALVDRPVADEILAIAPIPDRESRRVCRTQGGGLRNFRPHHRHIENVGLKLHQQLVA